MELLNYNVMHIIVNPTYPNGSNGSKSWLFVKFLIMWDSLICKFLIQYSYSYIHI